MNEKSTECVSFGLFIGALFAILLVSVLANLWIRVINNLAFNTFKHPFLNPDSFWWSIIVALIITGIFVGYVFLAFDNETSNALRTRLVGISGGGAAAANVSNIEPNGELLESNGPQSTESTEMLEPL
jgi:hypothetical protein